MRPQGTAAELEARRLRAADLLRDGKKPTEVAQLLGVGLSSVKTWKRALTAGGEAALAAKPHPGKPAKLDDAQKAELVEILVCGPLAAGYLSSRSRRGDEEVRRDVSSRPLGSHSARPRLHAAETRSTRSRTGRSRDRSVTENGLAAD